MAVNDIFRATANFTGPNGALRQWVWHYRQNASGDPSFTDIVDAIVTLLTVIWALIDTFVDADTTGETVDLALYDSVNDQWDTVAVGSIAGLAGQTIGFSMPGNVAPYVTFFTQVARSRGKKFLFDIIRDNIDDGALDVALVAAMADAADTWTDTVTVDAIPFKPGNFNQGSGDFRGWLNDQTAVGLFSGSQYKRLPGRGE